MIYKAAEGSRLSDEQAQQYGERIELINEKNNGIVTPADVLNDARSKKSPLHNFFDWDDTKAAEKWRGQQASYLLRTIHVVVKDNGEGEEVRAFYNVNVIPQGQEDRVRAYVTLPRVLSEADLRQQVVAQALRQLRAWQEKYKRYKEFADVFRAIEEADKQLRSKE